MKRIITIAFYLLISVFLVAQESTGIYADIREMSKETDPLKSIVIRDQIIKEYKLDSLKDAETLDMLNGNVALAFAMKKNYVEFEKHIGLIKNKFNQTSILSMAANNLLDKDIDADYACKIAKETLDRYFAFKEDPNARPEGYTKEDWDRFMDFAQYPYYDTYAKALFAVKKYKEALQYQRMAFNNQPEQGIPSSIERYATLLQLNGYPEESKKLLLRMAVLGKLNKGMMDQLQSFYVSERGSSKNFDVYVDSLQNSSREALAKELRSKLVNEIAPAFTLKDLKGKQVSLSDYKGKIVIIDLWATWCVPCIASFPAMKKEVEKHPDIVFLFIAVDEPRNNMLERVSKFIEKGKYPFHVLLDEPIKKNSEVYKITSTYKPNGIPTKYFIDKEGKLRYRSEGFDTDAQLMNEVDAMISILKSL